MLRFLLDSHVPRSVATGLVQRYGADCSHLAHWHDGRFLHAADLRILEVCAEDEFTLVTYDVRTIQPLLTEYATRGRHHAGVIFVDERTIRQGDAGGLIRSLGALFESDGERNWEDIILYLRPVRR